MKVLLSIFLALSCFIWIQGQSEKVSECSIQELAIKAALGDVTAQYNMGVEFHHGKNVPVDLAKSAAFWRLAVKGGNIGAHNNLGHLTYYGRGIKKDHAEGIRLWRIAAKQGFAESQIHLADAYSDGLFLASNYIEAYAWAKTGLHFASVGENADFQNELETMAHATITLSRSNMTKLQLATAEVKTALYIIRFAPK